MAAIAVNGARTVVGDFAPSQYGIGITGRAEMANVVDAATEIGVATQHTCTDDEDLCAVRRVWRCVLSVRGSVHDVQSPTRCWGELNTGDQSSGGRRQRRRGDDASD